MEAVIIALIGVISGGGLFKLIDLWLNRGKPKQEIEAAQTDLAKKLRDELYSRIDALSKRVDALETESADWQAKAFEWYQRYKMLRLKAVALLVDKGVPLAEAEHALKEDDAAWMP